MEDMARLALVEQNVRDTDTFSKLLFELLHHIKHILENPHDYNLRTIKSDLLKEYLDDDAFGDYLKYIGFQQVNSEMAYPKEQGLSRLRMAQDALERKIGFCCGAAALNRAPSQQDRFRAKQHKLIPEKVLNTDNPLLLKIEALFNDVLRYEDEDLQRTARDLVPVAALQLAALRRVREHQRALKAGEVTGYDLPFEMALLAELVGWFKQEFFRWVDRPACERCSGDTRLVGRSVMRAPTETCTVELYECTKCPNGRSEFPRYNDPRTLLRTRRGRCGEWANCFALLCRALGYDTRHVYDTTDHVWCEVYDFDAQDWVHVDPCEGAVDAPLLYSAGWGKRLAYVIAASRDDLQDVTWRYTTDHKEVLSRRTLCSERALLTALLELRARRQRLVPPARRRLLARRTLRELARLMRERTADDHECVGRVSGERAWAQARGEAGAAGRVLRAHHTAALRYCCGTDHYHLSTDHQHQTVDTWAAGAFAAKGVFRKVETDWDKVYIARQEGAAEGWLSWRLERAGGAGAGRFASLWARAQVATFGSGSVRWSVRFDDGEEQTVDIGDEPVHFSVQFRSVEVRAHLSGGDGREAWQHAQLFRQERADTRPALELTASSRPREP